MNVRHFVWAGVWATLSWSALGAEDEADTAGGGEEKGFHAGASMVDITPTHFPVIRNGGFLEGQILLSTEKLYARCVAMGDGETRLALVVVDSCMIPRELCDQVKDEASRIAGLPRDRILIAATHTHSAPSVMDYCLGSRADPGYTAFLGPKLVEAVAEAVARLEPAEVAWGQVDAAAYTHCRRWITRRDRMQEDPFGERTVRAMMHPGYENPDYVGPAGPVDPWLTFFSVRTVEGRPLALLANFSMHYFSGHAGASADYFGHFCRQIEKRMGGEVSAGEGHSFVGMLSQGTSGDLWWADYGGSPVERGIEDYAGELVNLVVEKERSLTYRREVPLAMEEKRLRLARRVPGEERLQWARGVVEAMGDRRPQDRTEVYAEQAIYLHENPEEEVVLQAVRVGGLGIGGMPNEVYGLTGLKVKAMSPMEVTMVIELANGAAGYIPPPEQHDLGGYTTWPARTAGLEVEAEPKLVEGVVSLLEAVSGDSRRSMAEAGSPYAAEVMALKPAAYWRLGEARVGEARDVSGRGNHGRYVGQMAYYLPGMSGPRFSGEPHGSRALHLADGHVIWEGPLSLPMTLSLWLYAGNVAEEERADEVLVEMGQDVRLSLAGASPPVLMLAREGLEVRGGEVTPRHWHHLAITATSEGLTVWVDGGTVMQMLPQASSGFQDLPEGAVLKLGRGFQGKLDEAALFQRVLTADELLGLARR